MVSKLLRMSGHSRQTLVPWLETEKEQVKYLLLIATQD